MYSCYLKPKLVSEAQLVFDIGIIFRILAFGGGHSGVNDHPTPLFFFLNMQCLDSVQSEYGPLNYFSQSSALLKYDLSLLKKKANGKA